MIVVCTSCQAKFRIPDEKVGAKGAKVRCSKCKTVFIVKREAEAPAQPAAPEADPFAAAASWPAEADPFAARDPFAAAPAPDPFAQSGVDPFASGVGESTASHLPLTDLSDLAGARGPAGGGLTALAPPLPPAAPPPIPDVAPGPGPSAAVPPPFPGAAAQALAGHTGLSLEESTSAGAPIPGSSDFAGFDPLESQMAAGEEASGLELGGDLYQSSVAAAPEPSTSPEITAWRPRPVRRRAEPTSSAPEGDP